VAVEKLQIIERIGDELVVNIREKSACGACQARNSCGHHLIDTSLGRTDVIKTFTLNGGRLPASAAGDFVAISIDDGAMVRMSLLLYGLPILFLLAGTLIGTWLANHLVTLSIPGEIIIVMIAAFFFVSGLWTVKITGNHFAREAVSLTAISHQSDSP